MAIVFAMAMRKKWTLQEIAFFLPAYDLWLREIANVSHLKILRSYTVLKTGAVCSKGSGNLYWKCFRIRRTSYVKCKVPCCIQSIMFYRTTPFWFLTVAIIFMFMLQKINILKFENTKENLVSISSVNLLFENLIVL